MNKTRWARTLDANFALTHQDETIGKNIDYLQNIKILRESKL